MKLAFVLLCLSCFAQTQGWEVSGTVTGPSGPLKDMDVWISGASYRPGVKTDNQGRYSLKGTVPGRYTIRVEKKDDTSEPPPHTLTLSTGMHLAVDFHVPKGGVITGRVLSRDKQPVADLVVKAMMKSVSDGVPVLTEQGGDVTNDLGEYRIPYLPDGAYVVTVAPKPNLVRKGTSAPATAAGREYPPVTFYPGTRVPETATVLDVRSGNELSAVDFIAQKEAARCLSFKVGAGFGGGKVYAQLEERLRVRGIVPADNPVAANTAYQICGLTAGEYRLHVYSFLIDEHYLYSAGERRMSTLVVDRENLDLGTLEPGGRDDVRGAVTVREGRPGDPFPTGLRVRIVAREMVSMLTDTRTAPVSPDRPFLLKRVFTGDYEIRVDGLLPGYYLHSSEWPSGGEIRVTVAADGAVLTGRVLTADGAAVPDAQVFLASKDSSARLTSQSDQTGAYQFTSGVRPGEYRLSTPGRADVDLKLGPRETRTVNLQ
jgi:hypothetical protein